METKKIINTTIIFFTIVVYVVFFQSLFTDKNTLVGVAAVTAAVSLLGEDYTLKPVKNTVFFITLEVILGILAYFSTKNIIFALIISFAVIFYILYTFTYNTRKPTYIAFTLGYVFMIYTPVTRDELPLRLLGLAFSGLGIMVLQLIINRNKLNKKVKENMMVSVNSIKKQITLITNNESSKEVEKLNALADKCIKNVASKLFELVDENNGDLPNELYKKIFVAQFLDSFNLALQEINIKNTKDIFTHNDNKDAYSDVSEYLSNEQVLKEVMNLIEEIEKYIETDEATIEFLLHKLEDYLDNNKLLETKSYLQFKIYSYIQMLKKELEYTNKNVVGEVATEYFAPDLFGDINNFKSNVNKYSLKFTFALRGALVVSLGIYIVGALQIDNGRWLVFSLVTVVQPYLHTSKAKGLDRIYGTIIGIIIFEVVFNIFTTTTSRTSIILLAGYLSNYQKAYKNQMIFTTISALGTASVGANIGIISFERLLFVLLGTFIALFANKFILPYKVEDATKYMIKKSMEINEQIISKIYDIRLWTSYVNDDVKKLIIINRLKNRLIDSNNQMIDLREIDNYIYYQYLFINEVRVLKGLFEECRKSRNDKVKLSYHIDYITKKDLNEEERLSYITKREDKLDRLVLANIAFIQDNLDKSRKISKEAIEYL